jgi:RHS repeat-associated protein
MNLAYDSRNRLTNGTVKGVIGSYGYDAEGVRQTATFNGVTTTYTTSTHAALSQVLKRVSTGGKVTWCVYGLGLLYEVEPDLATMTLDPNSYPPSYKAAEKTLVHHHDQIGNTVAVTDDQQRDVLWVQYDIYGAVVHAESPTQRTGAAPVRPEINTMPDKLARALAVTPYLFSGQQGVVTDPNGLLYMRARYYHPGLRRFVNPDPIGFEGGSNWYAYAGGNPLMANDPSGLAVRQVGWTIGHGLNRSAIFVGHHVLGKAWNSPNTAIGLAWGTVGLMAEAVQFPFTGDWDFKISFGNNAIQFEGHNMAGTAETLGNTISYAANSGPEHYIVSEGHTVGQHEMMHTYQGQQLSVLYLPAVLVSYGLDFVMSGPSSMFHGPWSFVERGPQTFGPNRPWNFSRDYVSPY